MIEWVSIAIGIGMLIISIGMFILAIKRSKELKDIAKSLVKIANSYKEDMDVIKTDIKELKTKKIEAYADIEREKNELERQRLAQRQREHNWREFRDKAKGIKWFLDNNE